MKMNERTTAKTTINIMPGAQVPCIWVEELAMAKMKEYIKGCNDEIGWLCTVEKHSEVNYRIVDAYLFKQEVHSTTTEITPEGLSDFAMELLAQPDGMDIWNAMKCWGHSHVNMGVFASGQDDTQMNVFKDAGHDFFIRVIANKKGEMEFTFYNYATGIIYKDTPWAILRNQQNAEQIRMINETIQALKKQLGELENASYPELEAQIKAEIALKVSKKTYANVWQGNKYTPYLGGKSAVMDYDDEIEMYDYAYGYESKANSNVIKKKTEEKVDTTSMVESKTPNYKMSECIHIDDLTDWFIEDDLVELAGYILDGDDVVVETNLIMATDEELADTDMNYLKRMILDYGMTYGYVDKVEGRKRKNELLGIVFVK
jgi:hypothetical protein